MSDDITEADIGHGARLGLQAEDGSFEDLAMVTRIKPVGWTRDEEEATHLQSPGRYKQFLPGLKEQTPCEADLNWIPSVPDRLIAAFEAGRQTWQITAPNGVRMQFPGFITTYEPGEFSNGKMTASVTIRPAGQAKILEAE
ncbi:phage tail tube protein [Rhodovulum sulfidophilum]|uniref:phage tail tube protein n=1 Tax=Rhodovulum sulfidophilum TaxID=35806 RepID=UPI000952EA82|nr:phage tail tube protein [Rhodovulum sulfidophilum]MCE8438325.1 hypothetical protein [Rhodovulum sulfidophilum]OLS49847.1 hypothetical protein BV379_17260 [Rhodovulum sulfidophilum]